MEYWKPVIKLLSHIWVQNFIAVAIKSIKLTSYKIQFIHSKYYFELKNCWAENYIRNRQARSFIDVSKTIHSSNRDYDSLSTCYRFASWIYYHISPKSSPSTRHGANAHLAEYTSITWQSISYRHRTVFDGLFLLLSNAIRKYWEQESQPGRIVVLNNSAP